MNQILMSPAITKERIIKYVDNSDLKPPKIENIDIFERIFINECLDRVDDPFKVISVAYVAKDLHCNQNTANEIFRRKDFPALCIGKGKKVMYLSYIIWKITRKE